MATAKARDVAYYLVERFNKAGKPTTNLKLQKVLYKTWISYYKLKKEYLFDDKFLAWKLGPVIEDVYLTYRYCGAMPIMFPKGKYESLPDSICGFLDEMVEKYKDKAASDLVSDTHGDFPGQKKTAWKMVYKKDAWNIEIPYSLIIKVDCAGEDGFDTGVAIGS